MVIEMPEWKGEYLLAFLHLNKNIDDFKELNLFPLNESWSGSAIPIILDKILFLEKLGSQLIGLDYLEHRNYIDDCCRRLEEYKRHVEIKEYIDNSDYA